MISRILFVLFALAALGGCATAPSPSGETLTETAGGYASGDVLAVLLPQAGRYAAPARALREGILAAQRQDEQGRRPQIRFYDSRRPEEGPALLRQAAAEGATLAIGPLQKAAVEALARQPACPLPTLALNRASRKTRVPHLYQFALAPEDEAADLANKAWAAGYRRALLLYPGEAWGARLAGAFRERWAALGGQLAGQREYDPRAESLGETGNALSSSAGAAPADFLLWIAAAEPARRQWPEIRRLTGDRLPVYASSHVHGGPFERHGDRVLAGLHFVDIPWLLAPETEDPLSPERLRQRLAEFSDSFLRLYAMGMDAYHLAPRLTVLAATPGGTFAGRTGRLRLDRQQWVRRELTLARMEPSGPVRLARVPLQEPRLVSLWP